MIRVRPFMLFGMAILSAACGAARSRDRETPLQRQFGVGSGGSAGIQVSLGGTITVQDRWVYITVPRGAVRTYQLDRQDYWDLQVRGAVAACKGREFEIVSEGRAVRLAPLLGLSRDAARLDTTRRVFRDTLRLDVGTPPGTDLSRSWIAFIIEWPFESVMATYTMHTNLPIDDARNPWDGRAAELPGDRCR